MAVKADVCVKCGQVVAFTNHKGLCNVCIHTENRIQNQMAEVAANKARSSSISENYFSPSIAINSGTSLLAVLVLWNLEITVLSVVISAVGGVAIAWVSRKISEYLKEEGIW